MPTIVLTLNDTPNGAVSLHTNFTPAVGQPCSPAQATALDIIARTHKQWGIHIDAKPGGLNMDAVLHMHELCTCDLDPTVQELETGRCMACGRATA
jgi:hypothetical protein